MQENKIASRPASRQSPGKTKNRRSPAESFELLDVQKVTLENPSEAVRAFPATGPSRTIDCDVLIAGGGTGGVAAALQSAQDGLSVCLTEETDWLGGQMTAQGVSALDENYLVETSGSTLKYQQLRSLIRKHYSTAYKLSPAASQFQYLNPGNCWVSRLSFEPSVAVEAINKLLAPAVENGSLSVFYRTKAASAQVRNGKVLSVRTVNLDDGEQLEFRAKIVIDATELGDLLPLCKVDYRTGAESQLETGEEHAALAADPENVQDFVFPFSIEFRPGEKHTIAKPPHYERFKETGIFSFFEYKMFEKARRSEGGGRYTELLPFWTYRRLLDRSNWLNPPYDYDLSMINWMANDLRGENIIDKPLAVAAQRLALGKALSLGFLYWLQTEAPRDDGGHGYPELKLHPQVMGTSDGLSKYPYIRESRRMKALHTIVESEIAASTSYGARAIHYDDTVGIGLYPIDIHGDEDKPGAAQQTSPFELPLRAIIAQTPHNLLACSKNFGTTHITNGAYRLHPIEWAAGEAAGALARLSIEKNSQPRQVLKKKDLLRLLQRHLVSHGSPIYWYDDVPVWHPAFPAIQFLTVEGVIPASPDELSFKPDEPLTRGCAARILAATLSLRPPRRPSGLPSDVGTESDEAPAISVCLARKILSLKDNGKFEPGEPIVWSELAQAYAHKFPSLTVPLDPETVVTRAAFAQWYYEQEI